MELHIFKKTVEANTFKSITIEEYIPINKEDIEFKWEETEGSWDNHTHKYFGYVPYYQGVKQDIYQYKMGKHKMIMSSLLADDFSYRLFPNHFGYFGLEKKV